MDKAEIQNDEDLLLLLYGTIRMIISLSLSLSKTSSTTEQDDSTGRGPARRSKLQCRSETTGGN